MMILLQRKTYGDGNQFNQNRAGTGGLGRISGLNRTVTCLDFVAGYFTVYNSN
jgi:hypothetical protein